MNSQFKSKVMALKPLAYWRLGEPSGTTAEDVLLRYPGAYNNTPTLAQTGALTGDSDTCVYFDAASSEDASFGDVLDFDYDDSFSIVGMFKTTATGNVAIVSKQEAASNYRGWNVYLDSTNHYLNFSLSSVVTTDDLVVQVQTAYNDGSWHTFAITYDGTYAASGITIYVDGVAQTVTSVRDGLDSTETTVSTAALCIGSRNSTDYYFTGYIDEVAIYDVVLTQFQALQLYYSAQGKVNYTLDVLSYDPEIYLPLDADVADISRHAVSTTAYNSPTYNQRQLAPGSGVGSILFDNTLEQYIDFSALGGGGTTFVDGQTMTIGLWFQYDDDTVGEQVLFSGSYTDDSDYLVISLNKSTAGVLTIQTNSDTPVDITVAGTYSTDPLNDGDSHSLVLVFTSSTAYDVYIDGVKYGSGSNTSITWSVVAKLALGQEWTPTATPAEWYNGYMSNFWLTKQILTATQVRQLHISGRALGRGRFSHSAVVAANTPAAWFKLDDVTGVTHLRNEIGRLHSILVGTSTLENAPAIAESVGCWYSAGTNAYSRSDDNDIYDFAATQPFSISLWFKTSGPSSAVRMWVSKRQSTSPFPGYEFYMDNTNKIYFIHSYHYTAGHLTMWFDATTFCDSQWHHAIVTYDGSTDAAGVNLYIDGVRQAMTMTSENLDPAHVTTNATGLHLGSRVGSYPFKDYLDQIVIFDKELSAIQARSLYFSGLADTIYNQAVLSCEPTGFWKLGDASGTVTDEMGNNDGTASGGPTYGSGQLIEVDADDAMTFARASSQFVDIASSAVISGQTDFVINGWIKPTDSPATGHRIWQESAAANEACALYINGSGLAEFLIRYSAADYTATGSATDITIAQDRVYMITARLDSTGGMSVFVNGRLAGTDANTNPTDETVADVDIAAKVLATAIYFNGVMDEVSVIPESMTDAEINELYMAGLEDAVVNMAGTFIQEQTSTPAIVAVMQDHLGASVIDTITTQDGPGHLEYFYESLNVSTVMQTLFRFYEVSTTSTAVTSSEATEQAKIVIESLATSTSLVHKLTAAGVITENINVADLMKLTWQYAATDTMNYTAAATAIAQKAVVLSTLFSAVGVVQQNISVTHVVAEALIIQAFHEWLFDEAVTESFDLSTAVADMVRAVNTLIESAALTTAVSQIGSFNAVILEEVDAAETVAPSQRLTNELVESLFVGGTLVLDDEVFSAIVLNATTLAPSEYTNFPFNSFGKMGSTYLGATDTAIYSLTGGDDDGTQIDAVIRSGLENFGNSQFKQVPRAYLGYTSDGALILKTISTGGSRGGTARGTKVERWYELTPRTADAPATARIKLGRGVKATYWQFELTNKDGADFDIDELKLLPVVLSRRV